MFHISDCKKYTRCPRIYFNDLKDDNREYHPFVRLDEEVTGLAIQKLGIKEYFFGQAGDPCQKAMDALQKYEWLVKARFEYRQLRVKVPFLHRSERGWDIYFLYVGLYPHTSDLQFYNDTLWVLEHNQITIDHYYFIHLNANYTRGETLDPDQLFVITDMFYNNHNHPMQTIRTALRKNKEDISDLLNEMENAREEDLDEPVRTIKCTGRKKCKYYQSCFPNEKKDVDNSILTLIASSEKYAMKNEGIRFLKDADIDRIEGSRMQYAQIMADREGGLYVDHLALHEWLSHIHYPIAFLDFEWERFAIPPYQGMKPYDVLPFEYALVVMQEDGTVTRKVYLNVHDDRRDMAESLIRDIPSCGTVLAYNADSAEKVRIEEFANMYPDLREALLQINRRMEDLQLPFLSGTVYDTRMRGYWSLKVLMSLMDEAGYKDLDIQEGMDAVFQWRHLDYSETENEEEKNKIIKDLKKYCGMDAYAMQVIYKWLLKLDKEV